MIITACWVYMVRTVQTRTPPADKENPSLKESVPFILLDLALMYYIAIGGLA